MAAAGNYQGALDVIREYWGAMIDLGATSFGKISISIGFRMQLPLMN